MPVSIRLSRIGTKHKPFYRMVIIDSRKKRDGTCIENIGTYDGLLNKFVTFRPERFDAWVALGAQPSETAKKLYRQYKKQGGADTVQKAAEPSEVKKESKKITSTPKKEQKKQSPAVEQEAKAE